MKVAIDTNVFVSALIDRDRAQRRRAEALFRGAAEGEHEILLPQCVLFEASFVLLNVYGQSAETVASVLEDVLDMPGIARVDALPVERWLEFWPGTIPEPIDAAIAAIALTEKASVATFDRRLASRLRRSGVTVW